MGGHQNKTPYIIRLFKCERCGCQQEATKKVGHRTAIGHPKHMWCFKCKEVTKFIQVD